MVQVRCGFPKLSIRITVPARGIAMPCADIAISSETESSVVTTPCSRVSTCGFFFKENKPQTLVLEQGVVNVPTVLHELTHIVDFKLKHDGLLKDEEWAKLNPEGFAYSESYADNMAGKKNSENCYCTDHYVPHNTNCSSEDIWFYYSYSKVNAYEDRATTLEDLIIYKMWNYEVAPDLYKSPHMKAKAEFFLKLVEKDFKMKFIPLDLIRETYQFDSRSDYSVPPAIEAFFESSDYESAIRKAISIGGDSDTIAAIAGSIAEAYYGTIPDDIRKKGRLLLDSGLKRVLDEFEEKYGK